MKPWQWRPRTRRTKLRMNELRKFAERARKDKKHLCLACGRENCNLNCLKEG